jgi:hypothetical protein
MDPRNPVLIIDQQNDSVSIVATVYDGKISYNTVATSLNNIISGNEIMIYPNPVKDNLCMKLNDTNIGRVIISILSVDGALIKEISTADNELLTIPVSDLRKGIYILKVKGQDLVYQTKFIKN